MTLILVTIPCLQDNYTYLIHDPASGATAVVDVPDPDVIQAELAARGWRLSDILITHHHPDHIDGVDPLRAATGARVVGAAADAHRLPRLDLALAGGDTLTIGTQTGHVIDVSGHTIGHIAYHFPASGLLFTADSLMALGCGRLMEGSPAMMWDSLTKLARLPDETLICSGHEYTANNAKFALTIEPQNPELILRCEAIATARAANQPTVPSLLSLERATNPFLRAHLPQVKSLMDMADSPDAEVFAEIRSRKDRF